MNDIFSHNAQKLLLKACFVLSLAIYPFSTLFASDLKEKSMTNLQILMAGDSTMAVYPEKGLPMTGWGRRMRGRKTFLKKGYSSPAPPPFHKLLGGAYGAADADAVSAAEKVMEKGK